AALMHRYRLPTHDLLVVYDDLDLPLGKIRIRERGSSGGHNGIKSIIEHLNSNDFPRLRVGIGSHDDEGTTQRGNTIKYVLGDFDAVERAIIQDVYPEVADAIYCLITDGITAAMNKYN
ncbi:MAG: aminoacyl-tRNA hydrolase, partial [Chloroflexota bacterium]|nr:aminoacyl-tRNA hydrolase [Chloroflexota bacterium]